MENCSGFTHPKDGSPTERERLPPSIYTAGYFKRVWAVSAKNNQFPTLMSSLYWHEAYLVSARAILQ